VWPRSSQLDTAVVGAVLGVVACVVALLASNGDAWPAIVLAPVALIVRAIWRPMPLWLLVGATAVPIMVAETIEDRPASATWLIGCVALVVAAVDRRRAGEWVPIALVVGGPLWLMLAGATDHAAAITAIWTMGLLLSATGGTILGQQRQLLTSMREAQAGLAAAAAAEERQRIARDLHDVVGHSFSVVLLHLAGARHLLSVDPERAEAALREAEEVGRQSMNDLRASLALLRSNDPGLAPVGGVAELPALAEVMRQAGLDVTCSTAGDVDRVDTAVGVVVHGVAREALTNAAKHGAPGPVQCDLTVAERVVLRVTNPIERTATSDRTGGHGVAGMRERARAVGGSLDVHAADGTWAVVLDVPVGAR
jgi:signal transduction histidine kinase